MHIENTSQYENPNILCAFVELFQLEPEFLNSYGLISVAGPEPNFLSSW